ncbi:MAG TPA: hypothetical protein VFW92_04240 [Candidatus Limnocylindrales bacterium]|nr:hypothetical protein [Candidatus Limnocylindrales bacterium]
MAARLTRTAGLALVLVGALTAAGCGPAPGPSGAAGPSGSAGASLPSGSTAQASVGPGDTGSTAGLATPDLVPTADVAAAAQRLQTTLQAQGFRLDLMNPPARPAEPVGLDRTPRSVYRVDLADPDTGIVVIYDLADAAVAANAAHTLAAYLASGFGQTNFPLDAQFAVAQVGPTVVMTWWAASRTSDPTAAERAFDAVASVGQPVPVTK